MAGRLTARKVETAKPGKYSDGGNLYLVVSPGGSRKWVFRFTWHGRAREMGLGSARAVSLADARERASDARRLIAKGTNPIEQRKRDGGIPTFGEMANKVHDALEPGFRNEKHKAQWRMTLTTYAAALRSKPVDTINTEDILEVLEPIWNTKPETASRVRGRIEKVLDAARAKGYRDGENPARWRGHLSNLLSKPQKLTRGHHAALAFEEMPKFFSTLRSRNSLAATALEFTILTAARSGETYGARWSEMDLVNQVWNVPAERMKAGRSHRVPLSSRAVEILQSLRTAENAADGFVFSQANDKPLSGMAMAMLLRRMGYKATVHGFRSTFRDWAGDATNFPREITETALAHVIESKSEKAYRRSDALEKRRKLMEAWGHFCSNRSIENRVVALARVR